MVSINDVLKASKGVPVDDIFAELWGRKLSGDYTIVTYTGTLPATITGTKAGYLHRYKIYGNLEQTGTPTPENPIVPQECGERTANLFSTTFEQGTTAGGTPVPAENRVRSRLFLPGTGTFTFSCANNDNFQIAIDYHLSDGSYSSGTSWLTTKTFDLTAQTPIIRLKIRHPDDSAMTPADVENAMLNSGTTALPYEPYGYKLPLTSAGQSVDIYLGESQTTRQIKKLVLTGTEDIGYDSAYTRFSLKLPKCLLINVRRTPAFCTHYEVIDDGRAISNIPDNSMYSHNADNRWYIKTTDYSTVDAFKSYLAAKYTAGTPVTIWYVLATPTTGILNEPLRKIGNYADYIDSTQTSAQIPTSANSTTISWAGSGLAPSQVEFEYERRR